MKVRITILTQNDKPLPPDGKRPTEEQIVKAWQMKGQPLKVQSLSRWCRMTVETLGEIRAKYNFWNEQERPYYEALSEAIRVISAQKDKCHYAKIVRCKECIHFIQGGWCDREFNWFSVDENDFCSMAEKMEVQG